MFFYAHSGIRYLVLLAGVLTLGYGMYGMAARRPYDRTMFMLARSFTAVTHLQLLLGIGLMLTRRFYSALMGHIIAMVLAAIIVTVVPAVMRRRDPAARSYLPHVIGTLVALALMAMGIMAIGRTPLGSAGG